MKKWNSPEIDVLDISKTENGNKKAFYEWGRFNDNITTTIVDFFEELINPTPSTNKGDNVTPSVEDRTSLVDDLS